MRKLFVCLICLVAVSAAPVTGADGSGGYAGSFFQVPAGARPTAMGGAYLAVSNDGAAPLFNPAGLATLQKPLFGTSYRVMQLDRMLGYATVAFPVRGESTIGAHWLYAGSGSVEARDSDGDLLGRDIDMSNHQFSILFAKRFEDFLSVGVNLSYLYSVMPEMSANTVGFDFGVMLYIEKLFDRERRDQLPIRDLQIGLTVKHISKEYRWNNEKYERRYTTEGIGTEQTDDVPEEFGIGISGRLLDRKLLLAADMLKDQERSAEFHAGAEYYLSPEFALRGGYGDSRFAAGTGYLFKIGKHQLGIDYAFSTDKADEGSEHIFSFDLAF